MNWKIMLLVNKQHNSCKIQKFTNLTWAVARILSSNNRGIRECMIPSNRELLRFLNLGHDSQQRLQSQCMSHIP